MMKQASDERQALLIWARALDAAAEAAQAKIKATLAANRVEVGKKRKAVYGEQPVVRL
ncbi:hypothetical protein [Roseiarcus fermentans]|uniref:hypothetical protein n=1 Tax=Roseiarcus fermentans TaxID=1473586 RepID=UPI0014733027|nr:hypothetical protein [Roseiarcus fermentans]